MGEGGGGYGAGGKRKPYLRYVNPDSDPNISWGGKWDNPSPGRFIEPLEEQVILKSVRFEGLNFEVLGLRVVAQGRGERGVDAAMQRIHLSAQSNMRNYCVFTHFVLYTALYTS